MSELNNGIFGKIGNMLENVERRQEKEENGRIVRKYLK